MRSELKPCPFCGGKAKLYSVGTGNPQHGHYHQIVCQDCLAATGAHWSGEQFAIDAWNTRKWKTCRLELEEPKEDGVWWCSYCKSYHQHKSKYPWAYCPRCGAKAVE